MTAEGAGEGVGAELLMSPARRRVMDALAAHSRGADAGREGEDRHRGMAAAELAAELGLHVTTVRFHLDQLVAAGLLTTRNLRGPGAGRPRKIYRVRSGSLSDLQGLTGHRGRAFEMLAGLLARHWVGADGRELSAEEAGRSWARERLGQTPTPPPAATPGQWLQKIGTAVDVLAEWGYTADVHTSRSGRQAGIRLVDCPFLDLARDHPDVVCAVHRGLLDGALSALGERTDISLEPFVAHRECMAHLTRQPFTPPPTERPR